MKPLHLNSEDQRGGAARAAYRLHAALRGIGVDSSMLVQIRSGTDPSVIGPRTALGNMAGRVRKALDLLPVYLAAGGRPRETFYPGWLPDRSGDRVSRLAPDLVHLHWITGGFVNVKSLQNYDVPLVWTLHDMWAFTGGCHYDGDCGRYMSGCGSCPAIMSDHDPDLSSSVWRRKGGAYQDLKLSIVTPSRWLGDLARRSPLLGQFPVQVIPYAIDTDTYRPINKRAARESLGLPLNRKVILFGALRATSEKRKGFALLQSALKALSVTEMGPEIVLVIAGAEAPDSPPDFGMQCIFLGTLTDDASLAMAYSAADVFAAPSTEDNLSNTVVESMTCGTPVVAFNIGGMPDMIDHRVNGYLADPFDTMDLANGLGWVIQSDQHGAALSDRARHKAVSTFEASNIAGRYRSLYESLLQ